MNLGAFSISLAVKDLERSKVFYGALGFEQVGGDASQGWLILRNVDHVTIGLFQGMFEKNMMTFNPGWGRQAEELASFTDIRDLEKRVKERGIALAAEIDGSTSGPANFLIEDPDGNPILFDQHR
jgi:catechol 2,3-dioxygenase-like lactoylglutathione lyase family enzyme